MKVAAYCTLTAKDIVKEAAGVEPVTSPPLTIQDFDPTQLSGVDILYFRLHGLRLIPSRMFGESESGDLIAAIGKEQIEQADLAGATVILANCYGAQSPMVDSFYNAGASTVIAGSGQNYASTTRVTGVDLLAKFIIGGLRNGLSLDAAMITAKTRLAMAAFQYASRDTLEFSIMEKTV